MRPEYVQGYLDGLVEMCVLSEITDIYGRSSYTDHNGNAFAVTPIWFNINGTNIPYEDIIGFSVSEGELQVKHYAKTCEIN